MDVIPLFAQTGIFFCICFVLPQMNFNYDFSKMSGRYSYRYVEAS